MIIKTKFHQATASEEEYISALGNYFRMLIPWDSTISDEENHARAAESMSILLDWKCDSIVGVPHKNGYSWKPKASGYYHSIKKEGK